MTNRAFGFTTLLAVVGVSIVFGMILGGRLNAPPVMLAAPLTGLNLAPASTAVPALPSVADIVEGALPAVVSVTSIQTPDERRQQTRQRPQSQEWPFPWFMPPGSEEMDERPRREQQRIEGEGSGFIIHAEGYVLTNNHVIEDSDNVKVRLHNHKEYTAQVVGTDPSIDLALLKIDPRGAKLPTLPLGDSEKARVGEWVIAIGNPLGADQTVTVGVLSGKERRLQIGSTDAGVVSFLQTDAAINFGNSGGPLLDARGNVIGINTAIRRINYAEGIGFALPVNTVRSVMEQLREHGFVKRGFIGISMNPDGVDETAREYYGLPDTKGVIISELRPDDGPAAKAGLKPGDVIRRVDGEEIVDNGDLIEKVASRQPGEEIELDVFRGGKLQRIVVTLADRESGLREELGDEREPPPTQQREPAESKGLGLTLEELDRQTRDQLGLREGQRGILVSEVDLDSEANDKGIRPDMLLTGVNDKPIGSVSDWNRALEDLRPGRPVKLSLFVAGGGGQGRSVFVYLRAPEGE